MSTLKINIPGFSIAYRAWGDPKNPPVIALHGWLDNANSFEPIAKYLEEHYYIIAIDLPGHGLSSHPPPGMHYHFIDGIFTVVQIIIALNLPKVHLLGHSLGACLASLLAGIAPQYLLSLSLIEALGPLTKPAESSPIQLSNYLNTLLSKELGPQKAYKSMENAARARALKGYVSLDIAKLFCLRGLMEKDGAYYWRHDKRLLSPSPLQMTECQVLACLKKIQAKTFLLLANSGFAFNDEVVDKRMKAINDLTVKRMDGGHHVHMEQPKIVAELLTNFYNSI